MSLSLRDLQRPGQSLEQVMRELVAALRADIANVQDGTPTRIHDIRVGTKKLRALLRLVDGNCPDAALFATRLRAIRTAFSGSRDAEVMRQRLAEIVPGDAAWEELSLTEADPAACPPRASAEELADGLATQLDGMNFPALTRSRLIAAVTAAYGKARKLRKRCAKSPCDDGLMHEWRKRTKTICYHLMALEGTRISTQLTVPLDALAERLGEYHDLSVLGERATAHTVIAAAVDKRKRKVRRECLEAAEEIFRRKPSTVKKRLSAELPG